MPDNFRLGLLPERKIDWRTLAASYGFVTFAVLCLLFVGVLFPEKLQLTQRYISTELIAKSAPPPKPVKIKKMPRRPPAKLMPVVVMAPKLIVPKDIRVRPKKQEDVDAPKLEAKFDAPVVVPVAAIPKQLVQTGQFGSSAPATLVAPIQKVQTGGFGAPDGLKGQGKENAHLQTASLGSFDLPQGAGQGNGSGGAKGLKGTVASTGFGNGIAQQDGRRNGQGTAQVGGFGGQQVAQASQHLSETGAATTPVQILYKPNPAYTSEARQLQLQGEVLLEVMFGANGQLQVNKVVRGLGHGLDESAVAAANKMKFKPALRNGSAVDSTAIVHVVFQLAS